MELEDVFTHADISIGRWGKHSLESIHAINNTYDNTGYQINAPGTTAGNGETIVVLTAKFYLKEKKPKHSWSPAYTKGSGLRVVANSTAGAIKAALEWWETKPEVDLTMYDVFVSNPDFK